MINIYIQTFEGGVNYAGTTPLTNDEFNLLKSIRSLPVREKDELFEIIHIKLKKNKYPNTD